MFFIGYLLVILAVFAQQENQKEHCHRIPHLFEADVPGDRSAAGEKCQTRGIPVNAITEKGAWCRFADPRAVYHENESGTIKNTYIGYIDVRGNIKATQVDHDTDIVEIIKTDAFTSGLKQLEQSKPYIKAGNQKMTSCDVLGNSDAWKTQSRGTGGHWHDPVTPGSFQLAVTYENGVLRTYMDGLVDLYAEVKGLSLSKLVSGTSKGTIRSIRIYDRTFCPRMR